MINQQNWLRRFFNQDKKGHFGMFGQFLVVSGVRKTSSFLWFFLAFLHFGVFEQFLVSIYSALVSLDREDSVYSSSTTSLPYFHWLAQCDGYLLPSLERGGSWLDHQDLPAMGEVYLLERRALAEPSGPWCLTFALGWPGNFSFFIQIISWAR